MVIFQINFQDETTGEMKTPHFEHLTTKISKQNITIKNENENDY